MKILKPRQRCETCNGEGRIDYFGLLSKVECSSCHGTGYSRKLPPLEYVHPEQAYADAVQRPDQASEDAQGVRETVVRKQSRRNDQAHRRPKEEKQSEVGGVQSDAEVQQMWLMPPCHH